MKRAILVAIVNQGGATVTAPDAPTALSATPVSTSQIDLAWTDNATNETEYRIYRSTDDVTYSLIDTIAASSSSYSDTTITSGTTYYYKTAAYNAGGETLSSAVSTNTLLFGLVEVWKFDEASGDAAGSHASKTLTNTGTATYTTGVNGNAVLTGTGKVLTRVSDSDLQTGNRSFTVACRVYPSAGNSNTVIMAKGAANDVNAIEYGVTCDNGSLFKIDLWQTGSAQTLKATNFGTFSQNTWYDVIGFVDVDAGTLNIEVNGVLNSIAKTKTPVAGAAAIAFGGYANNASNWAGRIDDGARWNRALTSTERAAYRTKVYPFDAGQGIYQTGQTYTTLTLSLTGHYQQYLIPTKPMNGTLVIFHHGVGQSHTAWTADALLTDIRDALLADGYILSADSARAENWGSPQAIADYNSLYADAVSRFGAASTSKTIFLNQSMGGMSGLNCISDGTIPVAGWYGIYPACDLAWVYANNPTFAAQIRDAYGIAPDGSDYATKTDGYDPMLALASLFNVPMRFTASTGDTVINKAANSDAMSAHVAATAPEETVVACTGNHGDPSHFQPSDVIAFFERC